ncbi:hypothetical protein [Marinibacterium sp. SX1]|uniref:hypothetical protein n=1 Tax=Marinibacterium sp. SX1 TaxID=3388424 RepID=UPI003D16EDAE
MTEDDEFDRLVGPCIAAARAEDARLPDGLMARVMADAARVQAGWQDSALREASVVRVPGWRQVLMALGGMPALGGLMAACAAGIWLGAAPPQAFDPLGFVVNSSNALTVYSDLQDTILAEGGN